MKPQVDNRTFEEIQSAPYRRQRRSAMYALSEISRKALHGHDFDAELELIFVHSYLQAVLHYLFERRMEKE